MNSQSTFFVTILIAVVCLGCGKHVGLSGKVVFSDDDSPVPRGTVLFATSTFQSQGDIKSDGTFTMGSFRERDGLPPGTYSVSIFGAVEGIGDGRNERIYQLLDSKWTSPSTSDYMIEVKKTTRNLVIKVDRNPQTLEQFEKRR